MRRTNKKFKEGAASFYIVAFATLVLMVIAASFAAIIISEVTRTSNDDLAQSAYDSALAGVEDAKIAFYNYQSCIDGGIATGECARIKELMDNPTCDMTSQILGRGEVGEEVQIQETIGGNNNNMQQAYTCVKIETILSEYKATLSGNNQTKVVRVRFNNDTDGDGVDDTDVANKVKWVRVSWYEDSDNAKYKYNNFNLTGGVRFPSIAGGAGAGTVFAYAEPPTLSVGMVQTSAQFNVESFDKTENGQTDRGMVYLVPAGSTKTEDDNAIKSTLSDSYNVESASKNYISAYNGSENRIMNNLTSSYATSTRGNNYGGMLKSNDKTNDNLPYAVYCPRGGGNEYVCSAMIELPKPIGDTRNNETFVFAVSIPYGQPTTDFELKFYCGDTDTCSTVTEEVSGGTHDPRVARLQDVQVKVDSTGRANDLYRRVETRLEGTDDFSLSALGPLELLGNNEVLRKDYAVTCEYDFNPTCR